MGPQEHSPCGPSTWDRTVRCPGSLVASQGYPDDSGIEAAEGTAFHYLMALCLSPVGFQPEDFVGNGNGMWVGEHYIEFTEEMADSGKQGLAYIREHENKGWNVLVEERVDISSVTRPGEFGTSDVIMWHDGLKEFTIFDWKYGHKAVHAADSYQIIGYALGAWESFLWMSLGGSEEELKQVKCNLVIEQPRVPGAGGKRTMSVLELLNEADRIKEQFQKAFNVKDPWNEPGVINPGGIQCEYCRVKDICKPRHDWLASFIDPLKPEHIPTGPLTPERIADIVARRSQLKRWLDEVYYMARDMLIRGESVPGHKLVYGRSPPRKWYENSHHKVELALEAALGSNADAFEEPKLRSPTDIEKSFGPKFYSATVEQYVDRGEKKLSIVKESDSRPAATAADWFDDETEPDNPIDEVV